MGEYFNVHGAVPSLILRSSKVTFNEREVIVIDDDEPNNHPIRLQGEPQGSLLPSLNDPMSNLGNRESNLGE